MAEGFAATHFAGDLRICCSDDMQPHDGHAYSTAPSMLHTFRPLTFSTCGVNRRLSNTMSWYSPQCGQRVHHRSCVPLL